MLTNRYRVHGRLHLCRSQMVYGLYEGAAAYAADKQMIETDLAPSIAVVLWYGNF